MSEESKADLHVRIDRLLFISGIVLLLIHSFFPISYTAQIIFFLLTVLLAGIPHGALDHLVEEQTLHLENKRFSWLRFLLNYFVYMFLYGLAWYVFPSLALVAFLIFSSVHFGETDLLRVKITGGIAVKLMQFCYGSFILLILLLSHLDEVRMIINQYPGLADERYLRFLETHTKDVIFAAGMLVAGSVFIYFLKTGHDNEGLFSFSFFNKLVLILLLLIKLPLILSFAFYFGLWHSLHSLENIRMHLSREAGRSISWPALMLKSLPLTLLAVSFIGLLMFFADFRHNTASLLLQFFIGIAILTAPHLQVMGRMYRKRG